MNNNYEQRVKKVVPSKYKFNERDISQKKKYTVLDINLWKFLFSQTFHLRSRAATAFC